jgi:hypothetical protein
LIGKLVIFGIIAIAAIVIVPNLLKDNSHVPALGAIKDSIDHTTTINHGQGNGTSSVGYGGMLANSSSGNSVQSGNTGVSSTGQTTSITSLPPQDVTKQTYTGQVFENTNGTCQVSVPGMEETINGQTEITHIIQVPNCNLPVNQPVQVTTISPNQNYTQSPDFGGAIQINPYVSSNNGGSTNSNPSTGPASPSPANPSPSTNQDGSDPVAPPYFQTVQLNAVNQGTSAMLSYDDTTGQTIQVTVTMKNSDKVLFSGTFYASQFHTEVNDVPNTAHIIEMTIQNAVYGTLHASIYAPPNIQNSTISGIFTNSTG